MSAPSSSIKHSYVKQQFTNYDWNRYNAPTTFIRFPNSAKRQHTIIDEHDPPQPMRTNLSTEQGTLSIQVKPK